LLAPGLGEETGRQAELTRLAIDLTRIMLISPVLFAVSGMFMGILNARRHFLTPALAPMVYNLAIIAAALVSADVEMLAVGVVLGAALHLAVQLPDLRAAGMSYSFVARWRDQAVREVGALMAPRVLGLAATQVNFYFVAIFFASTLSAGAISGVSFAWLIVMTPLGVIGMAISTAAFPTLAEQAARADREMASTLARALRLILFLSLPAGAGLMLLARPLVVVLLQRGAFDTTSTELTAQALLFYALALAAHGAIEITSRGFYALSDTRTPVALAIASMVLNLALAALLVGPLEVRGLALALSIATIIESLCLFLLLVRRVPGLGTSALFAAVSKMAVATGAMVAAVGLLLITLEASGLDAERTGGALITLLAATCLGGALYLGLTRLLGCEEAWTLAARVPLLARVMRARPGS
jgi:putative peptidoglycan lipid II flippase